MGRVETLAVERGLSLLEGLRLFAGDGASGRARSSIDAFLGLFELEHHALTDFRLPGTAKKNSPAVDRGTAVDVAD